MIEWEEFHCLEKMNFIEAVEYLKSIEEDGWRLPSKAELIQACRNRNPGFQKWGYWSSDVDNDLIWVIYFYTGNDWKLDKNSTMYVRFIRDVT